MAGTWTYSFKPSTVSRDTVRYLVGQTSSVDDALVYDEEITYALAQFPSAWGAAALVADALGNRYAALARGERIGELSVQYGDRAAELHATARLLRSQQALAGVSPYAGGISYSDRTVDLDNGDRIPTNFALKMNDNPRITTQSTST